MYFYFLVYHRAVALGLDADDMSAIDNFTEELKAKKKGGPGLADTVSKLSQDIGPSDSIRVKVCMRPSQGVMSFSVTIWL